MHAVVGPGDHHAVPAAVAHGAAQPVREPHLAVGAEGGAGAAGPVAGPPPGAAIATAAGLLAGHRDGEGEVVRAAHGLSIVRTAAPILRVTARRYPRNPCRTGPTTGRGGRRRSPRSGPTRPSSAPARRPVVGRRGPGLDRRPGRPARPAPAGSRPGRPSRVYRYDHWVEEPHLGAGFRSRLAAAPGAARRPPHDPAPLPPALHGARASPCTATGATAWPSTATATSAGSTTRSSPCWSSASAAPSTSGPGPTATPTSWPTKGATHDFAAGRGDLLVMGGACQAGWEHSVPKVPGHRAVRVSIQWRWASRTGRPVEGASYRAPGTTAAEAQPGVGVGRFERLGGERERSPGEHRQPWRGVGRRPSRARRSGRACAGRCTSARGRTGSR